MKRNIFLIILGISSSLFAAEDQVDKGRCGHILAEGDKYLGRVSLCDVSAEKHANIALAYYKRYELCKQSANRITGASGYNFKINRFVEDKPFECENHKKGNK